mmetsp:Transcript_33301/g.50238  ORF Transcript_33301/g.50238 Transcript_33301/m.50238 type:complete len:401 (+) Transcript_33301:198-1400(+)
MTRIKSTKKENKEDDNCAAEKMSGSLRVDSGLKRSPNEAADLKKITSGVSSTFQEQSIDGTNNHSSLVSVDGQSSSHSDETQNLPSQPLSVQVHGTNNQKPSAGSVSIRASESDKELKRPGKKIKQNDNKREERNAREKERSFRIAQQITELRNLLSSGGIIVPKGTKSSVLTEAGNYIRQLQQQHYESEIEKQKLVKHIQMVSSGTLGMQPPSAAKVAAQNGTWPLGSLGDVTQKPTIQQYHDLGLQNADRTVDTHAFKLVFDACPVGMAIASMGGAFVDCNTAFCQLSKYDRQELCSRTIFNLTNRQDLEKAFEVISQMISPPRGEAATSNNPNNPTPCMLRGSMKNGGNIGLSVALVKGDNNVAKCFCVTLIENPTSLSDCSKPIRGSSRRLENEAS